MRLYSYSTESHTFAEVKWVAAKIAMSGIVLGLIVFIAVVKLSQPVVQADESRSAEMLAAENQILRHQLNLISPRISQLELQVTHLDKRVNSFRTMFNRPRIGGDTTWRFTEAPKGRTSQSAISVARIF
jgi:hypothetical protein